MARHPARELISEGVIISDSPDAMSDEEKLFFNFRDDARETDAQPDLLIWRLTIDPRTDKPRSSDPGAFCTDTPMDSFKSFNEILSWIRDTYGSGYFRITGRMRSKDGGEKTHFNRVVRIAAPIEKPGATPANDNSDMGKLLSAVHAMNAQSERNMENIVRALGGMMRQQAPASEPLSPEKIVQWIAAGTALLGQFKGLFAPPAPVGSLGGLAGMLQEFRAVQDILGGNSSGAETNDSDVMNNLIKTFGPALAHMVIAGQQKQAAAPAPAQLAGPNPALARPVPAQPNPAPAPATVENDPNMNPLVIAFKSNIQQLIAQAKMGTPPQAVANFVLDSTDPDKIDDFVEFCEKETAIDEVIALVPEVAEHREWFVAFRKAILDAYEDEPGDEPTFP